MTETLCACREGDQGSCHCGGSDYGGVYIVVTINPEARVSVSLEKLPLPPVENLRLVLSMAIINESRVTSPLSATLLDPSLSGVALEFGSEELTGEEREERSLVLTFSRPAVVDLTIGFRLPDEAPDLGGRDRVDFLARYFRTDAVAVPLEAAGSQPL